MRRPLIAGNWKMNTDRAGARALALSVAEASKGAGCDVIVAPPSLWVCDVIDAVSGSSVGVVTQNCSDRSGGAFTGELSPAMLVSAGVAGSLVGHSERRALYGETNAAVGAKVAALRSAGLLAIACVGETLAERDAGTTRAVVVGQVDEALAQIASLDGVVIAYEPVWAIGTGRTASPEQAQEVHGWIRARARERFGEAAETLRILYGGSVTADNAAVLLGQADIDGALVGGASLKPADFARIIGAA